MEAGPSALKDVLIQSWPGIASLMHVRFVTNSDRKADVAKTTRSAVCHEQRRSKRCCATVREMKDGPSRRAVRFWPQTAASCCRQKRWW